MGSDIHTVSVLGTQIAAVEPRDAAADLERAVDAGTRGYVCFCNAHTTTTALLDGSFRHIANGARLALADGMAVKWAMQLLDQGPQRRSDGPTFMRTMLERSRNSGHRHFLFGGSDATLAKLETRFADCHIVGTLSPPFRPLTPEEDAEHAARIDDSGADFVWVALGAPKQEQWMLRMRTRLNAPVLLGVGYAFDQLAGVKPAAPPWMSEHGLEWLFRMLSEPRRLGPRYLLTNPLFVAAVAGQLAYSKLERWRA